jgi:hypothetical protein
MGLGLLREGINEVIATTRMNAAPMGIIVRRGEARMVVFRGSHTAERIEDDGWLVANFIFDPVLYVRTAFGDLPPSLFIEEMIDGTAMQRLSGAEGWAAFRAVISKQTDESLIVRLTFLREEVLKPLIHPVNRGFNSVIEATIHATRYRLTGSPELIDWIDHHAGIIRKCGGPREQEAFRLIQSYLGREKS